MKSIFITGSSSGIGQALSLHFERKGYLVFAGVRNITDGERLIGLARGKLIPVIIDVTDSQTINKAIETIAEETGGELDCLIDNAGVAIGGPLELTPLSQIRTLMDVNVVGLLAVTQACIPLLRNSQGRIINMGSISGRFAPPGLSSYAGSKFAVEGITDALRVELSNFGITVSVIEPGKVDTPIWDKALSFQEDAQSQSQSPFAELYSPLTNYYKAYVKEDDGVPMSRLLDVTEHAAMANKPKTRYLIGGASRIRVLLDKLPSCIRDRIVRRAMGM